MPHYHKLGEIPNKRHIQFFKPDGTLYKEELFSTEGFSNLYSNIYHIHPPTAILGGFNIAPAADYLDSRKPVLVNNDLSISLAAPQQSMTNYFYKNADADEVLFVHQGNGRLKTAYGELKFTYGDYIVVPRGVIYQMEFETSENRLLIIESYGPITYPKRYRNELGQLLEHSPYCERDIRLPQNLPAIDEKGAFKILIKKQNFIYPYTYEYHPFDLIGWDGFHYPYILSIHDFEPITGRIHQPPPVHQTFDGHNFVICSFVPRLYDYHPLAIPAPYAHSNIDSDEVMYYVDGQFMSKGHVDRGQMSLHPAGVPHGPTPGAAEKSIGKTSTGELAVMIDTFRPLMITEAAMSIEIPDYYRHWLGADSLAQ